jgi:hypothetical protein
MPTLVHVGHQKDSQHTPVYPVRGEHVGMQAQPPPRQRRLAARPLNVSRNGHSTLPAHDRPLCVGAQHATSPLQRKLARPVMRSSGLPSPRRFVLARTKQLVQPAIWPLLPDLVQKLQQSGATTTMVASCWQGKAWHRALTELACHETVLPARAHLFRPGRRHGRGTIGKPHWPVTVFRIPLRLGCSSAGVK